MKKIIAAIGTLLVVAGVKGQTTPVSKPTTPQATANTAINSSANTNTIKLTQKGAVTSKESSLKVTQKVTQKGAPTIKKTGR
jgi:hypothetical protein